MKFTPSKHPARSVAAVWLLCLLLNPMPALAQQTAAPGIPSSEPEPPVEQPQTSDITVRSQEALAALNRLTAELGVFGEFDDDTARLERLSIRVEALLPDGQTLDDLMGQPTRLDGVLVRSRNITNDSNAFIEDLAKAAETLETKLAEIRRIRSHWETVQREATDLPEALAERVAVILSATANLQDVVNERLNRAVELQNSTIALRNTVTPIRERVDSDTRARQVQLFEQNVPPVWKLTSEHISSSSKRASREFADTLRRDSLSWIDSSEAAIGVHLLLLPGLLGLLFKLRSASPETPSAALAQPVPSGVLIWMLIGLAIYATAPMSVKLVYVLVAMIIAGAVLVRFLPNSLRTGVVLFFVIALIEQMISGLPVVEQAPRLS